MLGGFLRDRPADGKDGSPAEETIQVTEEMIQAGAIELSRHNLTGEFDPSEVAALVYQAMFERKPATRQFC